MKYKVIYSPAALDDLREIRRYIAEELMAEIAAGNLTKRIREEVRSLSSMPERYARVSWEPWHSMGVRHFPVKNYVVFYTVDEDSQIVTVIRIFYGGRDIEHIVQEGNE